LYTLDKIATLLDIDNQELKKAMTDIIQIQESENDAILRQDVAVLPLGHTLTLMLKFGEDNNTILYNAQKITFNGRNRELLSSANSIQMHMRKNKPSNNKELEVLVRLVERVKRSLWNLEKASLILAINTFLITMESGTQFRAYASIPHTAWARNR
jgi:hypothetical protein